MKRLFALLPMVIACQPVEARRAPVESWSKLGVSFDQYRNDAIECAQVGYFRDVSGDEPAKRFLRGWKTAENSLNGAAGTNWEESVRIIQPDRRRRQVHAIQVNDVERCLTDRGYAPFTLSADEERQLRRYKAGSPERHRYMHGLAATQRPA